MYMSAVVRLAIFFKGGKDWTREAVLQKNSNMILVNKCSTMVKETVSLFLEMETVWKTSNENKISGYHNGVAY